MSIKMLFKLMRFKPVFAWSICSIILALSVAYYETGTLQNIGLLILSFVSVILIQSMLSHAVNDLCDEEVDKCADIESTGRTKVLLNGMATRSHLICISLIVLLISLVVMSIAYARLGNMIILFVLIGLYAALGYSVPPLKLGWRPFAEFTVVLPVIVTLIVAVDYVATGHLSKLALVVGVIHAFFNILWFMSGRMVDIDSDSKYGKVTTPIFMRNHGIKGTVIDLYYVLTVCISYLAVTYGYTVALIPFTLISGYLMFMYMFNPGFFESAEHLRNEHVKLRLIGMRLTVINAVFISLWLVVQKVYIL